MGSSQLFLPGGENEPPQAGVNRTPHETEEKQGACPARATNVTVGVARKKDEKKGKQQKNNGEKLRGKGGVHGRQTLHVRSEGRTSISVPVGGKIDRSKTRGSKRGGGGRVQRTVYYSGGGTLDEISLQGREQEGGKKCGVAGFSRVQPESERASSL